MSLGAKSPKGTKRFLLSFGEPVGFQLERIYNPGTTYLGCDVDGDFQVASWLVQPSLNTVSRDGTAVQLEPKVMSVLVCLADTPGQPVSKEKLLKTVWPDTFVGEGVLVRSVVELRRVFEDDAKQSRVIQTIAKRGYRLVAPVVHLNGSVVHLNGSKEEVSTASPARGLAPPTASAHSSWRNFKRPGIALGGAALLLAMFIGNIDGVRTRVFGATTPPIHSLAVLPLQNLSGDPGQEYFSDGMTEELITELSKIKALRVISRTSVVRYKKTDKSLPEIARELKVDAIVAGSVLRAGDRVRITAQLIYGQTDANLWAETYDRSLQDTLAVQEAVASAIADKIRVNMNANSGALSEAPRQVNFKAHEAYLRGIEQKSLEEELSNHVGKEMVATDLHRSAVEYYKKAIHEDPDYAPAYVALAEAASTPEDAEAYARKAIEADDTVPRPHVILACIKFVRQHNYHDAESEFLRAIQLSPSNAAAHQGYGIFLDTAGRPDEGLKEFQTAQDLDPKVDHLAGARYSRRQFDQVIESARAELGSSPELFTTEEAILHKVLMVAYARTGKPKESIEEFRRGLVCMGYTDLAEDLRRGYARGGYEASLREWLKGLKKYPKFPFRWLEAYVYTELADKDHAFALLPTLSRQDDWIFAYTEIYSEPVLFTLRLEPMWDPLHSDPRFDEFAHSIGLPQ
ncbi:MAG TPA: winged helix-turn-helix domain-containing protein [Candidatus Solibacter sp.]|nr:winged helix-turn-helix domain-containing protein [Candidatus Solibacter sp.]